MTLIEAINYFEKTKATVSNKGRNKVSDKFIYILNALSDKNLSIEKKQLVENKLDELKLKNLINNRQLKTALRSFEKFLKTKFSLVVKGHYKELGTALGAAYGIFFGILFLASFERSLGISIGISLGLTIGLLIGKSMDETALKEKRVL